MAAQIGEGRRYRQSKIDFFANLLLSLRFTAGGCSLAVTVPWMPGGACQQNRRDNLSGAA
jgi:hypothetical protein